MWNFYPFVVDELFNLIHTRWPRRQCHIWRLTQRGKERTIWSFSMIMRWLTVENSPVLAFFVVDTWIVTLISGAVLYWHVSELTQHELLHYSTHWYEVWVAAAAVPSIHPTTVLCFEEYHVIWAEGVHVIHAPPWWGFMNHAGLLCHTLHLDERLLPIQW